MAVNPRYIRVALGPSIAYTRGILRGVLIYAGGRAAWQFEAQGAEPAGAGGRWAGAEASVRGRVDGLIGHFPPPTSPLAEPVPAINVSDDGGRFGAPCVVPDNHAVGQLAADHLLERGCRSLAYLGETSEGGRGKRYAGFAERAGEAEQDVALAPRDELPPGTTDRELGDWLGQLARPVGLFCYNDQAGQSAILSAQSVGLTVPDDVAVIGVDNDDLICRAVRPELSSIALALEEIGQRAGALLDALMDGEPAPDEAVRVPPAGVVERGSSRVQRVADELVDQALRYMRDHATAGIDVPDVVAQSPASRRTLEYRFQAALGRSPHAELRRLQCQQAADLLIGSALSLEQIAEHCGFSSQSYFSRAFQKVMGQRPSAYRRRMSRS